MLEKIRACILKARPKPQDSHARNKNSKRKKEIYSWQLGFSRLAGEQKAQQTDRRSGRKQHESQQGFLPSGQKKRFFKQQGR